MKNSRIQRIPNEKSMWKSVYIYIGKNSFKKRIPKDGNVYKWVCV